MNLPRRAAAAGVLALSLVLTACGGGDSTAAPGGGSATEPGTTAEPDTAGTIAEAHNDADVQFAQQMIVHHRGALAMAEVAADRADSEEVRALAEQISAAQQPEIDTMTDWLQAWGEEAPEATDAGDMGGMDHGDMGGMDAGSMPGMMTEEQMTELQNTEGGAFDRMFLEMMVEHHQGAVEMAETEQAEGENPQAVELAGRIAEDQTREIERMQQLLQSL